MRHEAKRSIMHFIQQQEKYNVFTGVDILVIFVLKRTEFIASYLEITCVYYILLDNRDLQSCQLDKVKMWPSLPLPNQPSAVSVIKQSRD